MYVVTTSSKKKPMDPTKRKVLTYYRFLTTNSVGSEVVKMKSLPSDYIPKKKSRDPTKRKVLTTDFSLTK